MPFDRIKLSQEALIAAIGDGWSADQVDAVVELLAGSEGRFPSGARKLPSDLVRAVQRERLTAAMLKAASELGYRGTNVQDVIDRAGVSRPTFYEHFANKEDCFLAAFDTSAERLCDRLELAALNAGSIWRDRIRQALAALLEFARTEPETARSLVVEARAASADAVMRRVELLDRFATCLDSEVRERLPEAPMFSMTTATGIIGGVESLLYARLCKGQYEDLAGLLPSLMYFVVLPYEGHEAASEELALEAS